MVERREHLLRDQVLAVLALFIGTIAAAAAIKYSDLPTRVSVVESKQAGLEDRLTSMDAKLDAILERVTR